MTLPGAIKLPATMRQQAALVHLKIFNTSWSKDDITPEQQKEVDEKISKLRSKEMLTSCSTCHR